MMNRRTFLCGLTLGALSAPLVTEAQQADAKPRMGVLVPGSYSSATAPIEAFRKGLRELGYLEGQNIVIEWRYAEGRLERLSAFAAELVALNVDLIAAITPAAAVPAKQATSTIPIVFWSVTDPVALGLVNSLPRPGRNLTGISFEATPEVTGKQLELVKQIVPKVSRVAILWNSANSGSHLYLNAMRDAAEKLKTKLLPLDIREPGALERAFAMIVKDRAEAIIALADPTTYFHRQEVSAFAEKNRLPTAYGFQEMLDHGGLMSYGPSITDSYRRAAVYVAKILRGAKPADLPVEQPTRWELVINMKTAKALGLTIPPTVLLRADQVIE